MSGTRRVALDAPRRLLLLCCALLLGAASVIPAAHAQKWTQLAPFPEPSEELHGIAAGGKLYVFGGIARGWKPRGLVYEYDPAADRWTKKKPMILPAHHVALAEASGRIYVMGGFVLPPSGPPSWVPIDNAWEYDPANDTWKALAPLPTRRGSANAAVAGGRIYVLGGAGTHPGSKESGVHPNRPHRSLDTNEAYDPATDTWQARSAMPTARNHAAIGVVNNRIYVIGGQVGAAFMIVPASAMDLVEEYDPVTDKWGAAKRSMPTARSAAGWGTYKGRIYVAGGETRGAAAWGVLRSVDAYDPAANSWSSLEALPVPRHGHAGAVVGNRLHVVGGIAMDPAEGGAAGAKKETDLHEALEVER